MSTSPNGRRFNPQRIVSYWESSDVCNLLLKYVVVQADAINLLGIVNRGSPKLAFNTLARKLFWLCLSHKFTILVEWVPREINFVASEISKWLIPYDDSISRHYFIMLDRIWGPHTCDYFSTIENSHCSKFHSIHWCRGTSKVNDFGLVWSFDSCWVHAPFRIIGKNWRKLKEQGSIATIIVPLWTLATW
jgi:hypothetical protein